MPVFLVTISSFVILCNVVLVFLCYIIYCSACYKIVLFVTLCTFKLPHYCYVVEIRNVFQSTYISVVIQLAYNFLFYCILIIIHNIIIVE